MLAEVDNGDVVAVGVVRVIMGVLVVVLAEGDRGKGQKNLY